VEHRAVLGASDARVEMARIYTATAFDGCPDQPLGALARSRRPSSGQIRECGYPSVIWTAAIMPDITNSHHLSPRRRHRSYPRVIKRALHNSNRVKRPGDTGTRANPPPSTSPRHDQHRGMIN
jgi:hypothetical protein